MKKFYQLFIYFLICSPLLAIQYDQNELIVQNTLLAKVNGKSISVLDVQKKMDLLFYQNYPDLVDSIPAKYEFYLTQWKGMLHEMVKTELILADAADKKVEIKDSEIREELLKRYGPNIILTLNKHNLTYDEAWQMIKTELITMRMSWYFIHAKAIQAVSPQEIKGAYYRFCKENPPVETWHYQILSIRSKEENLAKDFTNQVSVFLQEKKNKPKELEEGIQKIHQNFANCSWQISKEYDVTSKTASANLLSTLSSLKEKAYSKPIVKINQAKKEFVHRIFYLSQYDKVEPPTFNEVSDKMKNELLQEKSQEMAQNYIEKLKKHYGYSDQMLVGPEFEPFLLR